MKIQYPTNNEKIKGEVASFLNEWENDRSFFESNTSGSTGIPKRIQINKKNAESSAKATIQFLNISPSETALLCLNIQTIGGKMMVVRSIVNGMKLLVTEPSSNPLKTITETIDFIAIAPIQLMTILQENPEKLKPIRNVIVGGGIISEQAIKLLKKHRLTVFQTFGMTETISHIALRKVGYEQEEHYTTLNGIRVSEQKGRLIVRAPAIGVNELETNDEVEIINDRQFKWIGRSDFIINSGGIKIQIEPLERELQQEISEKFFVHPKKDGVLGEKVVIVVEGNESETLLRKEFYSFLKNKYHIPKEIAFIQKIILTPSDKINRIANFEQIDEHRFKQIL